MKVLTLTIGGTFAHFRKIYGTNTALSYGIPPRTTVTGLLAALLGLPKERYHAQVLPEHLRVGVSLLSPIRKSFHRVNHLKVTGPGDFRGRSGHTQTPLELVSGPDVRQDLVRYRLFVAAGKSDNGLFDRLADTAIQYRSVYALCLGPAFCVAHLAQANLHELNETDHVIPATREAIALQSAVNRDWIQQFAPEPGVQLRVDEDIFPHYYTADGTRQLGASMHVLHGSAAHPLPVRLKQPAYRLPGEQQAFVFLENQ